MIDYTSIIIMHVIVNVQREPLKKTIMIKKRKRLMNM